MLRTVEKIDSQVCHSFFDTRFQVLFEDDIWRGALCLEYWEDQAVNFKFSVLGDIISLYSNPFVDQFPPEDVERFFKSKVTPEYFYSWVNENITLEVLRTCPIDDPGLSRIWEFSDKRWCSGINEEEYTECKILGRLVRCLPNSWGYGLRFNCDGTEKEKLYLYNLYLLKKYATGKYQGSDQECK